MVNYKDFKLILPNEDQLDKISDLIENKNGSLFHEVTLNNIIKKTFNTQLFYLVDNPIDIKTCAPIHVTKNKYGLKTYHFKPLYDIPYAGFVGNEDIEINKISIGLFESLEYKGFPFEIKNNQNLNNSGVGETTMVDLFKDEDILFNKVIHSKRRNMIRKALKSGITVKCFWTLDGLEQFWPILEELHKKLGYTHLTFDYYNRILENYGKKKQAFILLAFKDEKPISGVFIIGNNNYMHYFKGASVFGIKNEGQGELLQWEAIKLSKSLGSRYYDLCNLNEKKLPEIYRFKTGISKEIYQYPIYTKTSLSYKIINRLSKFL